MEVPAPSLNIQHRPTQKQDTSKANAGLDGPSLNYSNTDILCQVDQWSCCNGKGISKGVLGLFQNSMGRVELSGNFLSWDMAIVFSADQHHS